MMGKRGFEVLLWGENSFTNGIILACRPGLPQITGGAYWGGFHNVCPVVSNIKLQRNSLQN